jgi:hypothetical protein
MKSMGGRMRKKLGTLVMNMRVLQYETVQMVNSVSGETDDVKSKLIQQMSVYHKIEKFVMKVH